MHIDGVLEVLEAAARANLALAGDDPDIDAAASALMASLRPALRDAAMELAGQAAEEVRAQLPGYQVDVILADGEPSLRVAEKGVRVDTGPGEDFDARITLRLPPSIKALVEQAASDSGDSVNSWLVKTLAARSRRTRSGRQVSETFEL
jgi:hypothetical protein